MRKNYIPNPKMFLKNQRQVLGRGTVITKLKAGTPIIFNIDLNGKFRYRLGRDAVHPGTVAKLQEQGKVELSFFDEHCIDGKIEWISLEDN